MSSLSIYKNKVVKKGYFTPLIRRNKNDNDTNRLVITSFIKYYFWISVCRPFKNYTLYKNSYFVSSILVSWIKSAQKTTNLKYLFFFNSRSRMLKNMTNLNIIQGFTIEIKFINIKIINKLILKHELQSPLISTEKE